MIEKINQPWMSTFPAETRAIGTVSFLKTLVGALEDGAPFIHLAREDTQSALEHARSLVASDDATARELGQAALDFLPQLLAFGYSETNQAAA